MSDEQNIKPSVEDLRKELKRVNSKKEYKRVLRNTLIVVVTVAALAVLVSSFFITVLKVTGDSMTPTLETGEIVIAQNQSSFEPGDLIAFYYNNKVLVKRVIAQSGDWVDIDKDGNVYVNNVLIDEPYVSEKHLGDCNITLPYQVPDSRIFVMGDHREVSIDSRNTAVGCVADEQIVGKIVFAIWPLNKFGSVK